MTNRAETGEQNSSMAALLGPSLSIILAAMGISTAAVTLPELSRDFQGSSLDATLVVSIYILAGTALVVPIGRAGDLFGKRRVLVLGLCLFTLGAALAAYAASLPVLVASRLIQGAGAAVMISMPLALVRDIVPTGRIGRWMGIMGTMSAIGTASGPALGGAITAIFDWRTVFILQIPFAVIALFLCRFLLDDRNHTDARPRVDLVGAMALAAFLAAIAFFFSDIANGIDGTNIIVLMAALVAFAGFLHVETRANDPVIPLGLLRSKHLRLSLLMNAIVSLVMMGVLVVGPFFLSHGLNLTTSKMGLAMSVGPIASAISGVPAGRLAEKIGPSRAILAGGIAVTTGTAAMAGLPYSFGLGGFIVAFMLLSPGYQVFLAALNTSVMENSLAHDRGVTSGLLNLSRNFGFILGASTISALFWLLADFNISTEQVAQRFRVAMAGTFAFSCVLVSGVVLLAIISTHSQFGEDGLSEKE